MNGILNEMKNIKKNEQERGIALPQPNYIYIENYGRRMEEEMPEITKLLGEKDWFLFRADWMSAEKGIYDEFLVELKKHAVLGKEYEGCVLLELSREINGMELRQMLSDLKRQENGVRFILTVKDEETAKEVSELMEQFFFVRIVEGQNYEAREQLEIIEEELNKYYFSLDSESFGNLLGYMEEFQWKKTDLVQRKLQNVAKKIAYEKMLEQSADAIVTEEEVRDAMDEHRKESAKAKIGFVVSD